MFNLIILLSNNKLKIHISKSVCHFKKFLLMFNMKMLNFSAADAKLNQLWELDGTVLIAKLQ